MNFSEQWMQDAACNGAEPKLFFPERGEVAAEAKAICAGCTVSGTCLKYAMTHRIPDGVWGGKNADERKKLHKRALKRLREARRAS